MDYPHPRRWPRVRSTSPAVIEVLDPPASGNKFVAGSTRDFGAGGAYVVSEEVVAPGLRVQISVSLERLGRVARTLGSVVRCEPLGFAVEFDELLTEEALHLQTALC